MDANDDIRMMKRVDGGASAEGLSAVGVTIKEQEAEGQNIWNSDHFAEEADALIGEGADDEQLNDACDKAWEERQH